jgi:hypothetical protein
MSVEKMTPVDVGMDDQALFDDAEANGAPDTPVAAEANTEQPQTSPQPETVESATTETAKIAVDDNAPLVPSWRLREINEEKRTLADKLAALEAERVTWQRPQVQQPQPQQQEKPSKPDPLLDPDGYAAAIREEIRQEALNERREESLQRAADSNPDEFKEAYAAAQKAIDPALKARMQSSRDPGKTLLEWHRENKTKAEIGNDLAAYNQRKREEALNDPEFRKAAMAKWAAEAQPLTNGRPNVELPPSLSNASRSSTSLASTVGNDLSDEGLWEHANT